jgi:arsenite-transporting ATPase
MITDLIVPESKTKFLFFGGKGGVGKSTLSAATAVWLAARGHRTLLVSTDLQRSLSDIFEMDIGYRLAEIPGVPGLVIRETDPAKLVQAHWHRLAGTVQDVFGPSELLELMSREVSPCMMEMAGFYQLMELFNEGAELYDAIVFDTAPGGRALIEIRLPFMMIERYGEGDPFASFREGADPRLKDIIRQEARTRQTMSLITDPKRTVFLYVLWPESLPVAEAERAIAELLEHHISVPAMIINQALPLQEVQQANTPYFWSRYEMQQKYRRLIREKFGDKALAEVPLLEGEVKGLSCLRQLGRVLYDSAQESKHDRTH